MSYRFILLDITDRIATITFNDPERMNAMRLEMREECLDALKSLDVGDEADTVIFTGSGKKAFSAGADINELKTRTPEGEMSVRGQIRRELPRLVETMRLPSIAAINGYALGAGFEFALACTLRVAADSAKLGLPEIQLGVIPGSGGTQRLTRMVGLGYAMKMVTLGEPITADEAYRVGLINSVHTNEELISAAREICVKWQAKGAFSLRAARDSVLRSPDLDIQSGLDFERSLFSLCIKSGERDEGVSAFLEKRKPHFRKKKE